MICQRCAKNVDGIHTCTPTDGWLALETRIAELEAERNAERDNCVAIIATYQKELAALRRKIDEAPVVAHKWQNTSTGGQTSGRYIPLISKEDLQK